MASEDGNAFRDLHVRIVDDAYNSACPGRYMAANSLFIYAASVLSVLWVSPAVDDDGKTIPIELGMTSATATYVFLLDSVIFSSESLVSGLRSRFVAASNPGLHIQQN